MSKIKSQDEFNSKIFTNEKHSNFIFLLRLIFFTLFIFFNFSLEIAHKTKWRKKDISKIREKSQNPHIFAKNQENIMGIEKLSQRIKELRKIKCLSQEELATQSGVSLRTVQRVENAESTPSGETLKRILTTLGTSYETLIKENITEKPLRTLKGVNEYLHIFSDKLIINRSVTPEDIVKTYEKSISYMFKSLGVIFIGSLLFTIIAIVFFFLENPHLTIMATSLAAMFMIVAFLMMRFSSGVPYIERKQIVATKIEKMAIGGINLIIIYCNGKRIKERSVTFNLRDLSYIQEALLSENLLENDKIGRNYDTLILIISIPVISALTTFFTKSEFPPAIYAMYGLAGVVLTTTKVIIKTIRNNKKYVQSF